MIKPGSIMRLRPSYRLRSGHARTTFVLHQATAVAQMKRPKTGQRVTIGHQDVLEAAFLAHYPSPTLGNSYTYATSALGAMALAVLLPAVSCAVKKPSPQSSKTLSRRHVLIGLMGTFLGGTSGWVFGRQGQEANRAHWQGIYDGLSPESKKMVEQASHAIREVLILIQKVGEDLQRMQVYYDRNSLRIPQKFLQLKSHFNFHVYEVAYLWNAEISAADQWRNLAEKLQKSRQEIKDLRPGSRKYP